MCPTGGIKAETVDHYLACPNVVCVGGSWIAPCDLLTEGNYAEIEARARLAGSLSLIVLLRTRNSESTLPGRLGLGQDHFEAETSLAASMNDRYAG